MFEVKFDPRPVQRKLRAIEKRAKNPRPVMQKIANEEERAAKDRIRTTKMDPDGRAWAPWRPATREQRVREGNASRGLLYKSGLLLRSFTKSIRRMQFILTNRAPYAEFLQDGVRGRMRARPFLGWSRDREKQAQKQVFDYIKGN